MQKKDQGDGLLGGNDIGNATAERRDAAAVIADLLDVLKVTAGNIRSLGPAGALSRVYEPYTVWLQAVEDVIRKAEGVEVSR